MFGRLFMGRMVVGKLLLVVGMGVSCLTCRFPNIDLVDGQRPTHSRHRGQWLLLEFCLASKRETNGRRGSGRGQEIGRQFHFGYWVSWSTDGNCEKYGIQLKKSASTYFSKRMEKRSLSRSKIQFSLFPRQECARRKGRNFPFFILIFIQWIVRGADCHLDSTGFRGKEKNSQSTFTSCRVAVVFTRRAFSRINGWGKEIDHLVSWGKQENGTDKLKYNQYIQRYFRIGNPFTSAKDKDGANVTRGCLRLRMSLTTNWHSTQTMAR
jgi:hypothetical protein